MVKRQNIYRALMVSILSLFFMTSVFASVEVFSKYDTVLSINNDNTIDVNKSLSLKNVYDVGIVPGQIEFKSEVDYIRYLKDKLILNDVLFANWEKKKVVRNKSQVIKKSKPKSKKRVIKKVVCSKNLLDFME